MPSRKLYDLKVTLVDAPPHAGPIENEISRTIQIRGDLKLADLHQAIFDAFDREEEHMYEFLFDEETPKRRARYTRGADVENDAADGPPAGDALETTIASLGLKHEDCFLYVFDFGDRWVHEIEVVGFEQGSGFPSSPSVIARVGEAPPQYPD